MQQALWNVRLTHDLEEIVRDPIRLLTATLIKGKSAAVVLVDTTNNVDYFIARLTESRPTINLSGVIVEPEFHLKLSGVEGVEVELFGQPELDSEDFEGEHEHVHGEHCNHAHDDEEGSDFDSDMLEEMGSDEESFDEEEAEKALLAAMEAEKMKRSKSSKADEPAAKKAKKVVEKVEPAPAAVAVKTEKKADAPAAKPVDKKKDKKKEPAKPTKPIDNSAEKAAAEAALAALAGGAPEKPKKADKTAAASADASTAVRKQLEGGVFYEVTKAPHPTAVKASKGSKISIRYVGRLKSGKKFDSGVLDVKVGAGDVIKGFDLGLMGAAKGEERKIFIPAKMGYGSKKVGPIPANSDLIFDISVVNVK